MDDGDNGGGFDVAELCGATGENAGDNKGKIVIGARSARAEALQPGIDRGNDGTVDSLHENLDKIAGIETCGPRVSSDGNEGLLACGRNLSAGGDRMVRSLLEITLRTADGQTCSERVRRR